MKLMTGWRGHDPRNMLILPTEPVIDIAATANDTVLLTKSGKLFIGQYNGFEKGKLEELDLEDCIVSIAFYKDRIICVTKSGEVYSYCPKSKDKQQWTIVEPRKTCSHGKEEHGKSVKVKHVSAGVDHILFQSIDNEIWVQGKGPALGLVTNKTENEITNPTRVDYFKGRKILQATAGSYFTIALAEALPPLDTNESKDIPDMDSFVKSCDMCRKENGKDLCDDSIDKCPLGLGVQKDSKLDYLSPALSSLDLSSKTSINQDDTDSGLQYDSEFSCSLEETSLIDMKVAEKVKDLKNVEPQSMTAMFNTDTAKQFFSRPLSWVTNSSLDPEQLNMVAEKLKYKYPIDSATEMIKENVASAANLVRTVGDKVGQLSRHFSSSEVDEPMQDLSPDFPSLMFDQNKGTIKKSGSFEGNTFPRIPRGDTRKTHLRTSSGDPKVTGQHMVFLPQRNCGEVEKIREKLIEHGQEILNTEVWAWGSSNKGQLGLGNHLLQTIPTNVSHLNHLGVVKIVVGGHHTACLTIDGKVYVFGSNFWKETSKDRTVCVPEELIMPNSDIVRDIGSGEDFLIAITLDGSVFYIGNSGINGTHMKNIQLSLQSPKHFSVLCSWQSIICTTEDSNSKVENFVRDEVKYLGQLKAIRQHLIPQLMAAFKNAKVTANNNIPVKKCREALCDSFISVTHLTAAIVYKLWFEQRTDGTLPITNLVDEMRISYNDYITLYCDALAINALSLPKEYEECDNAMKLIPHMELSCVLPDFLALPLLRVNSYEHFLYTLRTDLAEMYSPFTLDCLKDSHDQWKTLQSIANSRKVNAETTLSFWKSHPKLMELVGTPSRRLILHSKDVAINLQKGGRFFSNSFILLSDVLIYNSYNSYVLYYLSTMWVESLPSHGNVHAIYIVVPEESFTLVCSTPTDKSKWLSALQEAIKDIIRVPGESTHTFPVAPPLVRKATYQFQKHTLYKDATYDGQWLMGKMDGEGSISWPDGKRYIGQFRQNVYQGYGRLEENTPTGSTIYEGSWKNGKLEGRGIIKYNNGDLYVGFLRESKPHGHGELKKGNFSSEAAYLYTGEWKHGAKQGYGVLDQINKGEKYHGMWQNNNRHGLGMVATMNDVYYEGNFSQNRLTGQGLVILEDGTYFEGEVGPGGSCNGKGTVSWPNGDSIEGIFGGTWEEGIKVNGILRKGITLSPVEPKSFGKMCVPASKKWTLLFEHCKDQLGFTEEIAPPTSKIWNSLASFMEQEKQVLLRSKGTVDPLDGIDKILSIDQHLNRQQFHEIQLYLEQASSKVLHPIGQLVQALVNAFRSTYGGVVSHPRLLGYAVKEVESFTSRLYEIVRLLFPMLPPQGTNMILEPDDHMDDDIVITAVSVIHPWILPPLYAPLSPLYVKHHEKSDQQYWQRLLKWNKQSDIALMTFLGVEMKLWVINGQNLVESSQVLSSVKDKHFVDAVEALQLLSTSFTPKDKLVLIHDCGLKIGQEVHAKLGPKFHLSMDELLPIFLYVVVRSRIQHLGAEIGFIKDLMDPDACNGKLEHTFTTLEASYRFILNENHSAGK